MVLGNNELTIPHPVSTGRLAVAILAVTPQLTDSLCVPVEVSTGRLSLIKVVLAQETDKIGFAAIFSTGKLAMVTQCVNEIHETFTGNENPLSDPWEAVGDVFKAGGLAQIVVDGSNEQGNPIHINPVCHSDQKCTLAITSFTHFAQLRVYMRRRAGGGETWFVRWEANSDSTKGRVSLLKTLGGVTTIEADSGFNAAFLTPGYIEGKCVGNVITATTNDVSINTTDGDVSLGKIVRFGLQVTGGIAVGAVESTSFDYVKAP